MDLSEIKEKISIVDYAASIGYTPVSMGRYYSLEEHDSVKIDTQKNCFFRNSCFVRGENYNHSAGSVIDFCMHFESLSRSDAIFKLSQYANKNCINSNSYICKAPVEVKRYFVKPLANKKRNFFTSTAYLYLLNIRKIEPCVLRYMNRHGYLYEESGCKCKFGRFDRFYHCCVFVSYNDKHEAVFAQRRACSFNGEKTYIDKNGKAKKILKSMTVSGSDENECFFINNHKNTLIVTEGICDLMAVMSMFALRGKLFNAFNYLATTGCTKFIPILHHLQENHNINRILVGFDNDEPGKKAFDMLSRFLKVNNWCGEIENFIPTHSKDHNDELCRLKKAISDRKHSDAV